MRSFEIDVFASRGSWVIHLEERIMSGAADRATAETIARHAARSLAEAGHDVSLRVQAAGNAPALPETLAAHLQVAA